MMISVTEKKLYKVLRNVGVKRKYIMQAHTIEDLYLDDYDFTLLVFYFENEFKVNLMKNDIEILTTLPAFYKYIEEKMILN